MQKLKTLVLAYPGSGKSYLADHYKNTSDFEFQHYRYDYGEYKDLPLEQLKGRTEIRKDNPDWPQNFLYALAREIEKTDIVLVPFSRSLLSKLDEFITSKRIKVILAIQDKGTLNELVETFSKRGIDSEFIERRKKDFLKCHEAITTSKFEKVYISSNEFLSGALSKIGVTLEKGVGVKNYF
ncbi:hypothetical protein IT418_01260 [bacterium]|nr:hypothetical protein [bacterium]